MLYNNYQIKIWKSEWIDRIIHGERYSLDASCYHDMRARGHHHEYIATIDKLNPLRARQIWGGSTPLIVLDLAKFSIDLEIANHRRWDVEERFRKYNQKCLKERLKKLSKNT